MASEAEYKKRLPARNIRTHTCARTLQNCECCLQTERTRDSTKGHKAIATGHPRSILNMVLPSVVLMLSPIQAHKLAGPASIQVLRISQGTLIQQKDVDYQRPLLNLHRLALQHHSSHTNKLCKTSYIHRYLHIYL